MDGFCYQARVQSCWMEGKRIHHTTLEFPLYREALHAAEEWCKAHMAQRKWVVK